jgi:hypothetical protein
MGWPMQLIKQGRLLSITAGIAELAALGGVPAGIPIIMKKPPADAGGRVSLKRSADSVDRKDQPNLPEVEAIRKAA